MLCCGTLALAYAVPYSSARYANVLHDVHTQIRRPQPHIVAADAATHTRTPLLHRAFAPPDRDQPPPEPTRAAVLLPKAYAALAAAAVAAFAMRLPAPCAAAVGLAAAALLPVGASLLFAATALLAASGLGRCFPLNYLAALGGSYLCVRALYVLVERLDAWQLDRARRRGAEEADKDLCLGTAALSVGALWVSISGAIPFGGIPVSFVG